MKFLQVRTIDRAIGIAAAVLAATLASSTPALAHAGHGAWDAHSVFHYLIEPAHAGPLLLAALAALVYRRTRRRADQERDSR